MSIVLYIISLTQNCLFIENEEQSYYGFSLLIFGFYAVFDSGFSWLANILIVLSWGLRHKKYSIYISLLALVLAISFLFCKEIVMGTNNTYGTITGYDVGYYLWALSFLAMLIAGILKHRTQNSD
ncbi:hypothetical protein [Winogradskyella sp.]|uniref:hypothetical protein n=1 Tax=Winogradskyella sp. TaxID=1883156 RepID=UPI0025FFA6F1|nr:hypothetical protein [Winogradskyella sp.]